MNGDNGNNRDDGNDDDDGDDDRRGMDALERLLRRGAAPDPAPRREPDPKKPPRKPPPAPEELPMSEEAARTAATHELSAYFNSIADPANPGLRALRDDPRFRIIDAVSRDDLSAYMIEMVQANYPPLNRRWFWHPAHNPRDVSFLTPAHVVRTHLMAVAISKHQADFKAPDSEGRLPLYYIARDCTDWWLIPFLVSAHKVDLRESGRAATANHAQVPRGHQFEEPLLIAINHGNVHTVEGMIHCVPYGFDLNHSRLPLGQTPLMIAVENAQETAMASRGQMTAELKRRLAIVTAMVSEPTVNLNTRDFAGNSARDYAFDKHLIDAWDDGLAERALNERRPRPRRDDPAP